MARPAATTVVAGSPPEATVWIEVGGPAWDELSEEGRVVVLTHECVHVTLAQRERPSAPRWLVEGVAEQVAYRWSSVPAEEVLTPPARENATGELPTRLPRDEDFELVGSDRHAALLTYARAFVAVRTYTRLHGPGSATDLLIEGPTGGSSPHRWASLERDLLPAWREDLRVLARSAAP